MVRLDGLGSVPFGGLRTDGCEQVGVKTSDTPTVVPVVRRRKHEIIAEFHLPRLELGDLKRNLSEGR